VQTTASKRFAEDPTIQFGQIVTAARSESSAIRVQRDPNKVPKPGLSRQLTKQRTR
jgi:hypothetical protein